VAEGVELTIDGRSVTAEAGELVIAAAERHGIYIPRFCYHPRMSSVGMCRMCLVDVDTGRGPTLQPACIITVSDGMVVETASETAARAQEGVLELLLVNHPLDCPVCDKGGECPLQDQAMAFGPGESRFVEEKRHFAKPIPISDLVLLDRERCVLCDRCTRFASEVAGDPLISFMERGYQTQIMTFPDDPFVSYFSGNTVQICPVGALTSVPYRFKARPWDLDQVESTCTSCSVGCRVAVQSSRDELVRYLGVDIDPVNHGWLCDKGRYDFEWVASEARLVVPLVRDPSDDTELVASSWNLALDAAADAVADAVAAGGPDSVALLGGARLSNEAAYLWSKLARSVIGTDNVDCQLDDGLPADAVLGLPRATIDDTCSAATILLLGPDPKEELPVLYLRLRDAVVHGGSRLVELTPIATGLTPYATHSLRHDPGNLVGALQDLLEAGGPVAEQLAAGDLVVVAGRSSLAGSADDLLEALGVLRDRFPDATYLPALRRANVFGALDMGLAPGMLPGRVRLAEGQEWFSQQWGSVPAEQGLDARGILEAAAAGRIGLLILLGSDPLADFRDADLAERALAGAGTVVAVDTFANPSVLRADIVLAAAGYAEQGGSTTNLEGRVSRLARKVTPRGSSTEDWIIVADLALRLGHDLGVDSLGSIWREVEQVAPAYRGCSLDLLESPAGLDGLVVPLGDRPGSEDGPALVQWQAPPPSGVPPPHAYRHRLVVDRKLYDAGTTVSMCPSLAGLAPGPILRLNPTEVQRLGLSDGERVQVTSARASISVGCRADRGVPAGVAALAFNQPGLATGDLLDAGQRFTEVEVETR